jgi:hypothetical protein
MTRSRRSPGAGVVAVKPAAPPRNPFGRDAVEIFKIDRATIVVKLRTLLHEINETAEEMEMVAVETVFTESLSRVLVRQAKKLRATGRELTSLIPLVRRAHMPGRAAGRSRKPMPRRRRKPQR